MDKIDPSLLLILWCCGWSWACTYEISRDYFQKYDKATKSGNGLVNVVIFISVLFYILG